MGNRLFFVTLDACSHINNDSPKKHNNLYKWRHSLWIDRFLYKPPENHVITTKVVLEPVLLGTFINLSVIKISFPQNQCSEIVCNLSDLCRLSTLCGVIVSRSIACKTRFADQTSISASLNRNICYCP